MATAQETMDRASTALSLAISGMIATGLLLNEGRKEFDRRFVVAVLKANKGNQCKAARELGVHRNTLSRTLHELQIRPEEYRTRIRRKPVMSQRQAWHEIEQGA
jgi:DNA-binding NtrC family response regulator